MKSLEDIKLEAWYHEMVNGFPEVYVMVCPVGANVQVPVYLSDVLVKRGPHTMNLRNGLLFHPDDLRDACQHYDLRSYYICNGLAQRYEKLVGLKEKGGQ